MFLLRMFSHLPFWALYALSDLLSFLMDHVIGYRKAVIDKNLAIAFPEMTEADKKRVRSGFYRHLSDIIVEMVKAISISESDLKRRVPLCNAEVFVEAKRRGLPVMVLGSHQGNWEWLFLGGSISSPIRIDGIYKPLSNKKFDALVLEIRGRFGNGVPIESDKVVRNIAAHRGEVRGIALLGDQRPHEGAPKIWATMFGRETAFFQGVELLPELAQAVVVVCKVKRERRGHYRVDLKKIAEPPFGKEGGSKVIDLYIAEVESMIRESPSDWLWSHDRWKYTRDDVDPAARSDSGSALSQ